MYFLDVTCLVGYIDQKGKYFFGQFLLFNVMKFSLYKPTIVYNFQNISTSFTGITIIFYKRFLTV